MGHLEQDRRIARLGRQAFGRGLEVGGVGAIADGRLGEGELVDVVALFALPEAVLFSRVKGAVANHHTAVA